MWKRRSEYFTNALLYKCIFVEILSIPQGRGKNPVGCQWLLQHERESCGASQRCTQVTWPAPLRGMRQCWEYGARDLLVTMAIHIHLSCPSVSPRACLRTEHWMTELSTSSHLLSLYLHNEQNHHTPYIGWVNGRSKTQDILLSVHCIIITLTITGATSAVIP